MGYLHIDNLYKNQGILEFRRCYALEKIHGTSAHIKWQRNDADGHLTFFSGGESHDKFVGLFDQDLLRTRFFEKFGLMEDPVIVFGEAYGGKQQGMSKTYGPQLRFVAFDVKIGDNWLVVPRAAALVADLGLEFVDYEEIETTLAEIDRTRDLPSSQARRNGVPGWESTIREGVVLRPPFEVTTNGGHRVIAKHKRDEFRESKSPRTVDPERVEILRNATLIAEEWVTPMRLEHVIDQLVRERNEKEIGMENIRALIVLMQDDVKREADNVEGWTKDTFRAIATKTTQLFKQRLEAGLREL